MLLKEIKTTFSTDVFLFINYASKCIELLLTFADDLNAVTIPKTSKPNASPITNSVRIAGNLW
jgi:hypothetical protein